MTKSEQVASAFAEAVKKLGPIDILEAGQFGVTVNCVSPGMIDRESHKDPGTWLERSGNGKDVAAMVAFLASPEANYITGVNYLVDGGRGIGPKNTQWDPVGNRNVIRGSRGSHQAGT